MAAADLLNHPIISQRYFFPRAAPIAQPTRVACDGATLACSYHESVAGAFTIVHFHGNGEVVADYLDWFPRLIGEMGANCFLAEFRGYGGSTGHPQLGRMLDDVRPTIAAIGQPHDRLIVFGRSVGSLFALKAIELFPDIAGLILESAIADPLERLLLRLDPGELGTDLAGLAAALASAIDIQQSLLHFNKPALILHTRYDGLIDAGHAEQLAAWCQGPARLEIFPEGNHNDIMFVNGSRYFALLRDFIEALRS